MNDGLIQSVLGATMTALVAGIAGLFVRLRTLEGDHKAAKVRIGKIESADRGDELKEELRKIEKEIHSVRLCVSEQYIRRDDWVPTASMILRSLEKQRELLARHDERLKHFTKAEKKSDA